MGKMFFDRFTILVCGNYGMRRLLGGGHPNLRGWAKYPEGFFGRWVPDSSEARRSMNRPKPVVFVEGVGWKFSIEFSADKCPEIVGRIFLGQTGDMLVSEDPPVGTVGYLATTSNKRVRVKLL